MPANVRYVGHVYTRDHNAFNCTPLAVLNVSRDEHGRYGFSPATRVFEAAGAGACLITDAWEGIELFLEPGARGAGRARRRGGRGAPRARSTPERARAIGDGGAARACCAEHTYAHRARAGRGAARRHGAARRRPHDAARHRHPRPLDHLVVGQRPRDDLPRRSCASSPRAATTSVPRARRAVVRRQPRPAAAAVRRAPSSTQRSTSCATRFAAAVRDADLVIVGSYVPDGVAVGEWVHATARGRHRLLRHRHAGDARQARRAATREYLAPDADPALRPLPLVHRRPDAARGSSDEYGARARAPLYCSVDPDALPPARRAEPRWDLGYLGTYSDDRQPALERAAARAGAALAATGASSSPGRSTRRTIDWPANVERIEHLAAGRAPRVLHRAALHAERHARRHGRAPAGRRACACSRPRRAACPSSATAGRGSTRSSRPARRSSSPRPADDVAATASTALADERARAIGARARARACSPTHTAGSGARRSSRRYVARARAVAPHDAAVARPARTPRDAVERRSTSSRPWFHNLHLPDGRTDGARPPARRLPARSSGSSSRRRCPRDLDGWRALDVGCNAGFYTFELARRGADGARRSTPTSTTSRQARWAADAARPRRPRRASSSCRSTTSRARHERFDLVLFMGVLYHLRYPLLALDLVAREGAAAARPADADDAGRRARASRRADLPFDERERAARAGLAGDGVHRAAASPATRRTGGRRTTRASRRCCARRASRSSRGRATSSGSAVRTGVPQPVRDELDAALGRG